MVKKTRPAATTRPARKEVFEFENSPYYAPVMFGVILIALLVLFRNFIFSSKMLDSSDTIQAGMFFRSFLVDFFETHHHMPMWNPYIFGGMPFVDAFHGDIFYPLSIIKYFMDTHRFLGMVLVMHIYLAGIFMYLCARQFKLTKTPALLSAVTYMFAAYIVSFVSPGHDGKTFVTALYPLSVLFLDRAFERRPFLNFSLLGLVIGMIIITPHVQMAYFTLWSLAFYTIFKLILLYREKRRLGLIISMGSMTLYAVVIGLLISAIQFYPGYKYTTEDSPRSDSKRGWEWATSWSMHQEEAFSLVIPEFSGTAAKDNKSFYWGKNFFKDNSEAVGAVTLFLGLLGIFFVRRKEVYFFTGLALFALLYALGATTPVFKVFFYIMPLVKSLRAPAVIMFLFSFSICLIAGMAIQHFREVRQEQPGREKKLNYLLFGYPALMLLLAFGFSAAGRGMLSAWCSIFYSEASTTVVQKGVTKLDVAYANLPQIQTGAWFAFLFTALAALFVWLYRSRKAGPGILVALLFVPMVDDMRFDARFIDVFDPGRIWAETPMIQYLKQNVNHHRVLDLDNLDSNLLPYHHIETPTGYHGNQLKWYDDLLGGPGMPTLQNTQRPYNPRFLNLVGTGYLITEQNIPPGYFGGQPVAAVMSAGPRGQLWRNNNAFPRAYLAGQFKVVPDRKNIYPLIVNGTDDLRQIVYLEKDPGLTISPEFAAGDSAWVIAHDPDSVVVGVRSASNKVLVLTDVYYDPWQATIDGRPAEILRSYGAFRAVAIPAGSSTIKFTYHSARYATGRMVTWLTSLYLVIIIGVHELRRRRASRT